MHTCYPQKLYIYITERRCLGLTDEEQLSQNGSQAAQATTRRRCRVGDTLCRVCRRFARRCCSLTVSPNSVLSHPPTADMGRESAPESAPVFCAVLVVDCLSLGDAVCFAVASADGSSGFSSTGLAGRTGEGRGRCRVMIERSGVTRSLHDQESETELEVAGWEADAAAGSCGVSLGRPRARKGVEG